MRIVLAEDSAVLRAGLVELLTLRGHEVVAEVKDADALRRAVLGHRPDVSIVDIRMPPSFTDEGLRAAVDLRRQDRSRAVLLFSQYVETSYAAELLADRAGGVGYLLKDRVADVSDFLDALRRVAAGETVLDPEVVSQLFGATRKTAVLDRLTEREREVLALMAEGRSNGAIAAKLYLSGGSVEKYVTRLFDKLGLPRSEEDNRRVLAVLRYLES
ncbi:response regulator transcription factor [Amycolatopsis acidiphila]|uniref:Response regulator transcription factor n=1 Tax=Amycolatopsis acidiphila TaxID=715473 RepID=A0A558AJZ8_9PSEU|nr:response regulator transcription factor [Amycolatopsis acidiphila]TVT24588.1 response regulator transcription factor [Amycolatopsis acidiphila]UIJ58533.1 response regulator transcription factor [Amycolatopsis acidiphila]GHG76966.1 DNA-binding response regulator [Amycolatopsis acidiphila]